MDTSSPSPAVRDAPRPFTGPASVGFAAVMLLALAVASFTTGLSRQLRLPRPDNTAKVVVVPPKEAPQAGAVGELAYVAPVAAAPTRISPRPRRHAREAPAEAPPTPPSVTAAPEVARAAPADAADVAAVTPMTPPDAPEAEP